VSIPLAREIASRHNMMTTSPTPGLGEAMYLGLVTHAELP